MLYPKEKKIGVEIRNQEGRQRSENKGDKPMKKVMGGPMTMSKGNFRTIAGRDWSGRQEGCFKERSSRETMWSALGESICDNRTENNVRLRPL